jgi:hypothetical protein
MCSGRRPAGFGRLAFVAPIYSVLGLVVFPENQDHSSERTGFLPPARFLLQG